MTKRFVHDEECALSKDVAPTADWDDPEYRPPKCTCRTRQKARVNRGYGGRSSSTIGHPDGALAMGHGCYIVRISRSPGD